MKALSLSALMATLVFMAPHFAPMITPTPNIFSNVPGLGADCQLECSSCFAHCKAMLAAGKKDHLKTLETCADCADICSLGAQLSARGGPFAGYLCEACAKSCDDCAAACEKFTEDEHMKKCAASCRACAKSCREMLEHLKK